MSTLLMVLLVIVGLALIWGVSIYNKLIALIEAINNNMKQIDIQLDRRFKVFESLNKRMVTSQKVIIKRMFLTFIYQISTCI